MKITAIQRAAYERAYGRPGRKGNSTDLLEMWERIKTLSYGECLILEPEVKENAVKLRNNWSQRLHRMARVEHAPFKMRLVTNTVKGHVVIWKEPATEAEKKIAITETANKKDAMPLPRPAPAPRIPATAKTTSRNLPTATPGKGAWCVNCYVNRKIYVKATKELDGDDLCAACAIERNRELITV